MQTSDLATSFAEYSPAESLHLSNRVFGQVADYPPLTKDQIREGHDISSDAVAFYEGAKDAEDWEPVHRSWLSTQRAYAAAILKLELRALPELTLEHLPIILDPNRNPAFNSYGLNTKVREFYKKHPDAERPKNVMGGTFLFAADPDCKHTADPHVGSGVRCARWFCF